MNDQPDRLQVNPRLPADTYEWIKFVAERQGLSVASWVRSEAERQLDDRALLQRLADYFGERADQLSAVVAEGRAIPAGSSDLTEWLDSQIPLLDRSPVRSSAGTGSAGRQVNVAFTGKYVERIGQVTEADRVTAPAWLLQAIDFGIERVRKDMTELAAGADLHVELVQETQQAMQNAASGRAGGLTAEL